MQLRPLTLQDKPIFDKYAYRTHPYLSTYAFTPLYVWHNHFQFYWTLLSDYLCIFAKQGDDYFMPILPMPYAIPHIPSYRGEQNEVYLNVIRETYRFMVETNRNPHIARFENVPQEILPFFEKNGFCATLKECEYVYETEALSRLSGNRYKSKRNAYNAFVTRYASAALIMPYRPTDCNACFSCYDTWHILRATQYNDEVYRAMLNDSRAAHRVAIANAEALGLIGRTVRLNGDISGYTFGYPLNADTFCILLEVADLRIKGLAQFIYREFCKELMDNYKWINAMDDSGLENLRRVKHSYHPAQLIPSYNVYL